MKHLNVFKLELMDHIDSGHFALILNTAWLAQTLIEPFKKGDFYLLLSADFSIGSVLCPYWSVTGLTDK